MTWTPKIGQVIYDREGSAYTVARMSYNSITVTHKGYPGVLTISAINHYYPWVGMFHPYRKEHSDVAASRG